MYIKIVAILERGFFVMTNLLNMLSMLAVTSPATGDNRNINLILILAIVAGCLIIAMVVSKVIGKKK